VVYGMILAGLGFPVKTEMLPSRARKEAVSPERTQVEDGLDSRKERIYVITAMMARSRRPTTVETFMPVSSAVASSEDSTGVDPLLTE
jgi:hypothetical protein